MSSPPPAYVRAMLGRLALRLTFLGVVFTLWRFGYPELAALLFYRLCHIVPEHPIARAHRESRARWQGSAAHHR